jgi:hypothetical protein
MTAWQFTRLAIGAALTWLILIFLNETYKELLKQHGLPGRFIDAIRFYRQSVSNLTQKSYETVTADSEPPVVKVDPKTDLLKSRRRIRRYALPPQVGILSLVIVVLSIALGSPPKPDDDGRLEVTFILVSISVYLGILLISYVSLEIVFWIQLRQTNFSKFGKIRAAARAFILMPYAVIFRLMMAALGFVIIGGVFAAGVALVVFLVRTIYEYAVSPHRG